MNYDLNFHQLCEMNYYLKERLHLINKRENERLCIGTATDEIKSLEAIQHFINWIEENNNNQITISINNE